MPRDNYFTSRLCFDQASHTQLQVQKRPIMFQEMFLGTKSSAQYAHKRVAEKQIFNY